MNRYAILHLVVLIYGFTGIIGRMLSLQGGPIVWHRMWIAAICLLGYILITGRQLRIPVRSAATFLGIGLIVAAHWTLFFQSIKVSNVSIALACLSSTTIIAAFLEPLFFRKKTGHIEVITGLVIIASLSLIFHVERLYVEGMIMALCSAFLASLFAVLNKKIAGQYPGTTVTFYEMLGGFLGLSVFLSLFQPDSLQIWLSRHDAFWVAVLGSICTAFAFSATLKVLEDLSAYSVVLAINLEPVYGILLAALIFREHEMLSPTFYAGALILVATVMTYSYQSAKTSSAPD